MLASNNAEWNLRVVSKLVSLGFHDDIERCVRFKRHRLSLMIKSTIELMLFAVRHPSSRMIWLKRN
jgi:hypothetical protein